MLTYLRALLETFLEPILRPIVRPIVRLIAGVIAVPLFRVFRQRVVHLDQLDQEFEKDIDQWFRASLLLLLATKNMEALLFPWVAPTVPVRPVVVQTENTETPDLTELNPPPDESEVKLHWFTLACRILLAVGVIEAMPDQELFLLIHPGLRRVKFDKDRSLWKNLRVQWREVVIGLACQHLNRSSPVLAIMCAIAKGRVGWVCFGLAISQYLFIGLVTSRDKALDVLAEFDRKLDERRQELAEALRLYRPEATGPSDDGS